jgi:FkbM family methyltransferase
MEKSQHLATAGKELVSYAQNCEDILLWRAFSGVPNGFYIDVGANDPNTDSVTRIFYEAGWHGINVEPVSYWQDVLAKVRPRDINLTCLVGSEESTSEFFEVIEDTRLSTTDAEIAEGHMRDFGYHLKQYDVKCTTLASICKEYVHGPIHFLKIDVEGGEYSVLKGMDFNRFRPMILVVEATKPCSAEECHDEWEPLILRNGYRFALFDGLSRYYIANEHSELGKHFTSPANIQDSFITLAALQARQKMEELEKKLSKYEKAVADYEYGPIRPFTRLLKSIGKSIRKLTSAPRHE